MSDIPFSIESEFLMKDTVLGAGYCMPGVRDVQKFGNAALM
jgi:hypothetical protein